MRGLMARALAFSLGAALCLSGMASASSEDLLAAARKEGKLRVIIFSSYKNAAQVFEKKYGIRVEGTYVGAPDILRKVSQETQAGIHAIDVFATSPGPLSGLNHWTQPYRPAGYERVAHVMKPLPRDWNQVPLFNHAVGASYNRTLVAPDKAPRSIQDLLKAEYKGKIISRTPWLGSNYLVHIASFYAWFGENEAEWAAYWMRFKANVARYEPKWGQLHAAVGLKEFSLGIFTLPYTPYTFGRSYPDLGYSTFREPAIWWPNMAAIHKNAPHPNAARLFVDFLVSAEGQSLFRDEGLLPADSTVDPLDALQKELDGVRFYDPAPQIIAREVSQNGETWKARIQKLYQ